MADKLNVGTECIYGRRTIRAVLASRLRLGSGILFWCSTTTGRKTSLLAVFARIRIQCSVSQYRYLGQFHLSFPSDHVRRGHGSGPKARMFRFEGLYSRHGVTVIGIAYPDFNIVRALLSC